MKYLIHEQEHINEYVSKNIKPKKDKINFLMSFKVINGKIIRDEKYYEGKFKIENKLTIFGKVIFYFKNIFKVKKVEKLKEKTNTEKLNDLYNELKKDSIREINKRNH